MSLLRLYRPCFELSSEGTALTCAAGSSFFLSYLSLGSWLPGCTLGERSSIPWSVWIAPATSSDASEAVTDYPGWQTSIVAPHPGKPSGSDAWPSSSVRLLEHLSFARHRHSLPTSLSTVHTSYYSNNILSVNFFSAYRILKRTLDFDWILTANR